MIKRKLYFVGGIIGLIALAFIYQKYDPAKYSLFPKCPFHLLTGFDCPGCGSQRAMHALLHGNLREAMGYNILLVISIPFLMVHFYHKLRSAWLKKDIRWAVVYHPLTPKIIFVVVALFWISRNIPVYPFSCLSPGR